MGDGAGDKLGGEPQGIAIAGDVDNDAIPDLLMAAPLSDALTTDGGEVYLMSSADMCCRCVDTTVI